MIVEIYIFNQIHLIINLKEKINFFLEDIPFSKCEINSYWLAKTFGTKIYNEFKNKTVCCGGTILGNSNEIIEWLNLMDSLLNKYPFKKRLKYLITFRRDKNSRGSDQAHGNYIVYKNLFKNGHLYSNREGPIATVMYLKTLHLTTNHNY